MSEAVALQHVDAVDRGADCLHCPLYECHRGPVPSQVVFGSRLAIVGEAPGENEVAHGENFVGWSGEVVNEAILVGGQSRGNVTIANAIACQPPPGHSLDDFLARSAKTAEREGREWKSPIDCCAPRLKRDIEETNPVVFLAVGTVALASLSIIVREHGLYDGDKLEMSKMHGSPVPLVQGRFLFASYHPAFAARDPKWMEVVRMNMARAVRCSTRGWIDWQEPDYVLNPTVEVAVDWLRNIRARGIELTIDLETCDATDSSKPSADQHTCLLRCVGLGVKIDGAEYVIVIPFRHMDGTLWSYGLDSDYAISTVHAMLINEIRMTVDVCPIAGHNVYAFDSEIMLRLGLMTDRARLLTDSILLHHNTRQQDLPHRLAFVGAWFFEVPAWKTKEDLASTDNADDGKLAVRCARDVLVTQRAIEPLRIQVIDDHCYEQNETDTKFARILRDMSNLGQCVDEYERGRMSSILNTECDRLHLQWKEQVGRDVNPRSPDQMQELLYGDWGLEPPITTEGKPFDAMANDVEDGAVSVSAILALLDRGLDPKQEEALETLLSYKALDKPRGSYCDKLRVRPFPGVDLGIAPAAGRLLERPGLSWVRSTWNAGRTPVGRSAAKKPGEQQRPKLGRRVTLSDGSTALINMRKMIVAAPGHVLVSADYKQSHVRIYAASAGDEMHYDAIRRGLNVHILNAASLLASNETELWQIYESISNAPSEEKEYWKLVAKKYVFATIYGAIPETVFKTMKIARIATSGKRAFPKLMLHECEEWAVRWHKTHPWTKPWQRSEFRQYRERGYAQSPILDERKRWGPLEQNQIPNHAILAFEGSLKNKAIQEIDERVPHRGWSDWSGMVYDGHDCLCVQVPMDRGKEAAKIVEEAMAYRWREMEFGGDSKVAVSWGDH